MNFFDVFGLPTSFIIDKEKLHAQFLQLQSQHHPDTHSSKTTKQNADQQSAVINIAYNTLNYADSRASHLLELVDQADQLQNSITDLDFLELAMDFRTELDEATNEQLPTLKARLDEWLDKLGQKFHQAYNNQQWETCILIAQKLKFLVKIDKDLSKQYDKLATVFDDDDLYV
ncbi:Fe-S protein assembly co-chaperone HscB [Moraxella nasovis]|uniref:Fe-S protein assembly co-chaperone HscB n=1 Tax=Moraxella nasovis TaxID=2904121 RepID=UPI001F606825|nr:Fe-S protein assembly co-chaperone HscB [Moraxella nasovis]UNU73018.1 Fe-S protein assembly co-chaperone HscB [Moraxella nasovis]